MCRNVLIIIEIHLRAFIAVVSRLEEDYFSLRSSIFAVKPRGLTK